MTDAPWELERRDQIIAAGRFDPDTLTDHGQVILRWLAGWGPDTVSGVIDMLEATRTAAELRTLADVDAAARLVELFTAAASQLEAGDPPGRPA